MFGITASALAIICFLPYLRDIFKRRTTPHSYSWLIWSILQIIGALAIIAGGGGYAGAANISIGALFCLTIFFLSLRYGTKNITKIDTISFIGALIGVVLWIFTKNPLASVILVTLVDLVGFVPTIRKSYQEPNSETASTYSLAALSDIFALLALSSYSLTTSLYLGSLVITNSICVAILLYRRTQNANS